MSLETSFPLSRITTRYSEVEDRILVSGSAPGDVVFTAWLTRRLLNRLVQNLSNLLSPRDQDGLSKILNEFSQQKAESLIGSVPAVNLTPEVSSIEILVETIDIENFKDFYRIILKNSDKKYSGILIFTNRDIRQWLSILRKKYQLADWSTNAWPVWLLQRDADRASPRPTA